MPLKHNPRILNEDREFSFLKNTPEYAYKFYNLLYYRFEVEVIIEKQDELENMLATMASDLYYLKTLTSGTRNIPGEFEVRFASEEDAIKFKMMDLNWFLDNTSE